MVEFGVQVTPTEQVGLHRELVAAAEEGGVDLVAVQDHPYAPTQLDAMTVIGDLLARTERLRFFPDVAPLPLRPPGLLAQSTAALDVLSGGRFELGLGAGGIPRGITGIGGPDRTPAEALEALEEGIGLLRRLWTEPGRVVADGKYYPLNLRTGPVLRPAGDRAAVPDVRVLAGAAQPDPDHPVRDGRRTGHQGAPGVVTTSDDAPDQGGDSTVTLPG
ncbi:LLM class flavin-dependent oxidoreductase [Kribbella sp. NPDC050124]|uniref:LLM class flavin-dependent oxidoreductase n=1 Tax=Kribbella sp. NPDC050124 TaxID=3364114 RepID=UPI0037B67F61